MRYFKFLRLAKKILETFENVMDIQITNAVRNLSYSFSNPFEMRDKWPYSSCVKI